MQTMKGCLGPHPGPHPSNPEARGIAETICRGFLSCPCVLFAEPVCVHACARVMSRSC